MTDATNPTVGGETVSKSLSATMVACIDLARANGGELVRYQGGFWSDRGGGHPTVNRREYHGASTVQAIVDRGYAAYSEHREGRNGSSFPIAMKLRAAITKATGGTQ
jgi:hypothetical protein